MNIQEFFTPAVMAANWTEVYSNQIPYLGTGLFPSKKKAGLDLAWLKGNKGLPISLMPSAFDAQATYRDRIGFEKLESEMPFFREGFKIKEKDRQELLRVQDSNDPYAEAVIARVFDDANELIAGANVVPERMIMQLLFAEEGNVGITMTANGVNYTYDYDPEDAWKGKNYIALTGKDAWTAPATFDPFKAFKKAKDVVRKSTGTVLTTAIMNSNTFDMLCASDAIKNRFLTTNGMSVGYLTEEDVKDAIRKTSKIDIVVYDKYYKDESGETRAFVPDGYVAVIPDGALGSTWYGTTPEEADLQGKADASVSIVNTGVAITVETINHPVNINTIASEIVLPSFERMDEFVLMKVVE